MFDWKEIAIKMGVTFVQGALAVWIANGYAVSS